MENLEIREATINDAEYISLLARITFTETFGHYFRDNQDLLDYYDRTFSVSKIKRSLQNENNVFWIALWEELPVGYAKLKKHSMSKFINSNKVSQLQKIYILRDFIPKKIGYHLQNVMFEKTAVLKSEYLWLSVLKTNDKAIKFYKRNGFLQVGEHLFHIGKETFDFMVLKKDFI